MKLSDSKSLWNRVFEIYRSQIDPSWYDFMLQNLSFSAAYGDTIYLICPTDFIRQSVENKDLGGLKNILQNDLGYKDHDFKLILSEDEIEDKTFNEIQNQNRQLTSYRKEYTFENFVQGNSNQLAYAASLSVAELPAIESPVAYNPLFIYGGVGLGKTHLMHAIANKIDDKNKNYKIEYVSSETFTNELIEAIRENTNEEFRNKYRSLDVILIDDIQFLAGKEGTQEEFFHTFNALHSLRKQIIISSDKPPKEIATLEDRLRSRFEQGLIVDIQPPDFETRVAILKNKAQSLKKQYMEKNTSIITWNMDMPSEAYNIIAKNIKSNIRELEGALNKVYAYASLMNIDITLDMVKNCLKDIVDIEQRAVDAKFIMEVVGKEYGVKVEQLTGKKRTQSIAYPRQIAMYLTRELTELSLPKIGEEFNRDHTTVIHACEKISEELQGGDSKLEEKIDRIKNIILGES